MIMLRLLFILGLLATLVACGGSPGKKTPAPVESRADKPTIKPTAPSETTQTYAYRKPQVRVLPQPGTQQTIPAIPSAANTLLKRAKAQKQAGDYAAAAASLERGLRIAPGNATLWHELAMLRAQQKRYAEVEQFAAKSNALAGNQPDLKSKNWQLIAQARTAQGDHAGAAAARQKLKQWQ